jgi:ABC-type dipeptide/oligopeptide/nickel transport system permease subunit
MSSGKPQTRRVLLIGTVPSVVIRRIRLIPGLFRDTNRITQFGFVVAAVLVLVAALSPLLASWERVQSQDLVSRLDSPDRRHWMGRDQLGRDELARIMYGARVSMLVGLSVVTISSVVGVLIGAVSGYAGGSVDRIVLGSCSTYSYRFPEYFLR